MCQWKREVTSVSRPSTVAPPLFLCLCLYFCLSVCLSVCRKHINMLFLLLHTITLVCFLAAPACVSSATTDTVVGMAGRKVTLPCHSEAVSQTGVEVCWGRGEPSLFSCQKTVIYSAGDKVTYKKSYRYSVSSSSSLSIFNSRPSDSGFYHCRVHLPGLFNDQTSIVHLIIINSRSVNFESSTTETSEISDNRDAENLNAPQTTTGFTRLGMTGSDVTTGEEGTTGPVVALVQSSVQQQQVNSLQSFIGNTVRVSFIIFIPAVMLTAAYRLWRTNQRSDTDRRPNQSDEEEQEDSYV
ncbi:hepatitis A virus cellular receptor 1 [Larimichthys crocea]|uniref:hepatitis A virus cellular receptor 1 n=1 Tax=Larimichthys crocea TaxID=215358 RepID=UPI000F5FC58F|nr:hepatitis A virus cellular receptor 1 [Larimichthys crocea]